MQDCAVHNVRCACACKQNAMSTLQRRAVRFSRRLHKKNIIFVSTKLKMSQLHIRHVVLCSTLYAYELIFLFSYGIGKVSRRYFSFLAFSSVWFASSFRMFGVILLHKRNASSTRLCHVSVNSARHSFSLSLSLPLTTILTTDLPVWLIFGQMHLHATH